jgi:single-strand DNA-binding protein
MGLATNYVYNNQQTGQKVEQVEFHNVVLWRKLGEIAAQYLKKGRRVYIEGRLQTRSWDSKDGQKRSRTEIIADNMIMLDGAQSGGGNTSSYGGQTSAPASKPTASPTEDLSQPAPAEQLPTIQQGEDINVEDIPF